MHPTSLIWTYLELRLSGLKVLLTLKNLFKEKSNRLIKKIKSTFKSLNIIKRTKTHFSQKPKKMKFFTKIFFFT